MPDTTSIGRVGEAPGNARPVAERIDNCDNSWARATIEAGQDDVSVGNVKRRRRLNESAEASASDCYRLSPHPYDKSAQMSFQSPPASAAWRHRDAREGFEVVFVNRYHDGYRLDGGTAAVENGEPWVVDYAMTVSQGWLSRGAVLSGRSVSGVHELKLEADGAGHWWINGSPASHLDGCLDVDLESSALTNAFPAHRLGLEVGQAADAPAAYVRALDFSVERLEQRYVRLENDRDCERYQYTAPGFGFECQLLYDESGLVIEYPGIAIRAA